MAQRANSPDRVPVVGAVPDEAFFESHYHDLHHGRPAGGYRPAEHVDGLYVNLAHGSRGFTTAFLGAEIIASMVDGAAPPVGRKLLDHLNPARFIVRRLKQSKPTTI